jgi:hypothetical protein
MVPALKSSDHTIKCACGNCDAVLLLHAEDAQAIATTPQKQRGGANLPVGTRVVNAVTFVGEIKSSTAHLR